MNDLSPLIKLLIQLAITYGSPYFLKLLKSLMTKLPETVQNIINALIDALEHPEASNSIARKTAAFQFKNHCDGKAGCSTDLK